MAESTRSNSHRKCVFVVGATASGKSAWALEQAKLHGGSVVNIDSVQFYKDLVIGSAAPTEAEKKEVPHYLYSYVEAPGEMTAARCVDDFYALTEKNPAFPLFIVGGTGFYVQALEKGMFDIEPVPAEVREALEAELARYGAEGLHMELLRKDPESKIHLNDHYRIVRALEIIRHTGLAPSQLQAEAALNKNSFKYPYIKVGFDFEKSEFAGRVRARTQKMLNDGLIEETRGLLAKGLGEWAPMRSVGYRETLQFLGEGHTRDWLADAVNQSTMQLIKKQKTWFKRDASILWSNQSGGLKSFLS